MNGEVGRQRLRSRHEITGTLVMDTALHIGGGREGGSVSDSPVVRLASGEPYIPGSSLKGAFRAAVERIAGAAGFRSCGLIPENDEPRCLSTDSEWDEHYRLLTQAVSRGVRLNATHEPALTALGLDAGEWIGRKATEALLLQILDNKLCDTCKTFGSVHLASVVAFHDLAVVPDTWHEVFQVRDGVGIDRDSERARDQIKFDYEVIPPSTAFHLALTLESARARDLQLVALGLHEMVEARVPLGGIRSRGLGRCHLEGLQVAWVDMGHPASRQQYFLRGAMDAEEGAVFIVRHLSALPVVQEG